MYVWLALMMILPKDIIIKLYMQRETIVFISLSLTHSFFCNALVANARESLFFNNHQRKLFFFIVNFSFFFFGGKRWEREEHCFKWKFISFHFMKQQSYLSCWNYLKQHELKLMNFAKKWYSSSSSLHATAVHEMIESKMWWVKWTSSSLCWRWLPQTRFLVKMNKKEREKFLIMCRRHKWMNEWVWWYAE